MFRHLILFIYIILGSGVLSVNIYNSVVDARNWGSNIPGSIEAARNYFSEATPASFFKYAGAALHVIGLLALILLWKSNPATRWYLVTAFVLFIMVDVLTVVWFFPRNDLMFRDASLSDIQTLKQAWTEWNTMNWIRSLIALAGVVCTCFAFENSLH